MGQHKHNPNAKAAKEGKLPEKSETMPKHQVDSAIMKQIERRIGINSVISFGKYICT